MDTTATWGSADWRASATQWILSALSAAGLRQTGPIEQPRIRFWSTQLTIDTSDGRYWFKANNPGQLFEARLVGELARIAADHVVAPLAVDTDRGWMLTRDQGPTLYAEGGADKEAWARVVGDFARLQRELVPQSRGVLATGLPVLAPSAATDFTRAVLAAACERPVDDPRHVDADLADRVVAALRRLEPGAERLQSGPIPLSLEHNDLHDNNCFVPQADRPLRFFDFGDSVWSHPFVSMAVPVEHMCGNWEVGPDAPEVLYVLDAYLEVWSDIAPIGELRDLMQVALPFGQVHRLRSWDTVLVYADPQGMAELGGAIPGWLDRLVTEVDRTASH